MDISREVFLEKIDLIIRLFFYILVFWLPYSPAVVESCVITAVVLWIVKRLVMHWPMICSDIQNLFKAFKPPSTSLNRLIYYFLIICLISVASSILWQQALADLFTKILEWFAILWLIQESFKNKKQLYLLMSILIFSGMATAVDAIVQFDILGKDIFYGRPVSPDGRATASFKAPSGLGTYMATIIPLCLASVLIMKKGTQKVLLLAGTGIMIYALILTFTRGAWAGAFAGILLFFFTFLIWLKRFEMAKTFLLAGVFLVLISVFPLLLNTKATLNMIKRSNTASWRLDIWEDSWQMIKDRPVFGHGVNTYMPIFQSYRRDPHNYPTYAHNCFVQLAAELGLLGLAAFCWIFIKFFLDGFFQLRTIEREKKDLIVISIGLLSAIAAFLVHSIFDTNLYALQLGILLWFLVGIQIKINQLVNERVN